MKTNTRRRRIGFAALSLGLALWSFGCDSSSTGPPSVTGTWWGAIPDLELELTVTLFSVGDTSLEGFAEITSPATGTVQGDVTGFRNGEDVTFTIQIDGDMIAGTPVFEGAFLGDDTMVGEISSGLLGGSWPITLERQQA